MQNSRISKQVCIFLSWVSFAFPQIEFDVHWTPYVTYYLSMVDINTGEYRSKKSGGLKKNTVIARANLEYSF